MPNFYWDVHPAVGHSYEAWLADTIAPGYAATGGNGSLIPALTPAFTGRDSAVRLNGWPHSGQAPARHFGWPQQFPGWSMVATRGRHVLPQGALSRAQGGPFSLKLSG